MPDTTPTSDAQTRIEAVLREHRYSPNLSCCRRADEHERCLAQMLVEALGLTEECHTYEHFETTAVMGGEGNMRYGGQTIHSLGWRTETRLVTPWARTEPNE